MKRADCGTRRTGAGKEKTSRRRGTGARVLGSSGWRPSPNNQRDNLADARRKLSGDAINRAKFKQSNLQMRVTAARRPYQNPDQRPSREHPRQQRRLPASTTPLDNSLPSALSKPPPAREGLAQPALFRFTLPFQAHEIRHSTSSGSRAPDSLDSLRLFCRSTSGVGFVHSAKRAKRSMVRRRTCMKSTRHGSATQRHRGRATTD